MKLHNIGYWVRFGAVTTISAAVTVALLNIAAAFASDISSDSLRLAPGVAKAQSYETPPTSYIVANPTSVYSDHSFFGTKATGELKRGEHVDALAKVKGYDWLLVGKNGTGIGYVSISMLAPADKFIP
ncbi:MAG TPA: hypothetical protein VGZ26_03900 [Pirellulales bacterium]|nr:hypothetical protein [Pirellulales bacterium]